MLEIKDLHAEIEGKEILKGVSLNIEPGKVYALMGPNGSGKSTLSNVLMGHPKYEVTKGTASLDGKQILGLGADERARLGLFLSFQYPYEIPGITISNFIRTAYNETKGKRIDVKTFAALLSQKMELLKMDKEFSRRHVNVGFSGGEKKRAEILQMAMLEPRYAILDETDSGLDVDALRVVSDGVKSVMNKDMGILIITHYQRILHHITPDMVMVMVDGKIVKTGDHRLADEIEKKGYSM
jgi:Fe-S cluster assembly ATP-binding protein